MRALRVPQAERFVDAREFKRTLLGMGQHVTEAAPRRILRGHTDGVLAVTWLPDGRTLVSGSKDGTVCLWDTTSGKQRSLLEGHIGPVTCLAAHPAGALLASGGADACIHLWQVNSEDTAPCQTLEQHTRAVSSLTFAPDGATLASTGGDRVVRLWRVSDGTEQATLSGPKGGIGGLAFSPDGDYLASQLVNNGHICLWDVFDRALLRVLREKMPRRMMFAMLEAEYVTASVAYSPDGLTIASGSSLDSTVRIWDISSGVLVGMFEGHRAAIASVAYSPDGQTIASASLDGYIRLWSVADGRMLYTLEGHTDVVTGVAFHPNGELLASSSLDQTVRLWKL
jgi:WD40 repeat protein